MKKVLLTTLCGVALSAMLITVHAQELRPATVSPTVATLDLMSLVADQNAVAPAAPPPPAQAAPPAKRAPAAPAAPAVPPGTATPLPAPSAASRPPVNVRFDVTITDTGSGKPVTKTLSLTVYPSSGVNNAGSIRNSARIPGSVLTDDGKSFVPSSIVLNVDVRQVVSLDPSSVRASVSVEYQPYVPEAKSQPGVISASATSVFVDGRRTQILQAADPISDRRTTVEVTATILK
jgi:hypothetical protein